jgi:hypothetical protein
MRRSFFAEHRHVLLLLGNAEAWQTAWPGYPDRVLAVHRIAATGGSQGGQLIDREGAVAARYGSVPAAFLIRPDGYVGFRCRAGEHSEHLPRYLARLLGPAKDG